MIVARAVVLVISSVVKVGVKRTPQKLGAESLPSDLAPRRRFLSLYPLRAGQLSFSSPFQCRDFAKLDIVYQVSRPKATLEVFAGFLGAFQRDMMSVSCQQSDERIDTAIDLAVLSILCKHSSEQFQEYQTIFREREGMPGEVKEENLANTAHPEPLALEVVSEAVNADNKRSLTVPKICPLPCIKPYQWLALKRLEDQRRNLVSCGISLTGLLV